MTVAMGWDKAALTVRERRSARGDMAIWGWLKKAAKWAKDHVVGGAKWIGVKFRF
jgi:hypothetical protein